MSPAGAIEFQEVDIDNGCTNAKSFSCTQRKEAELSQMGDYKH